VGTTNNLCTVKNVIVWEYLQGRSEFGEVQLLNHHISA
jgi:hypothetical protein